MQSLSLWFSLFAEPFERQLPVDLLDGPPNSMVVLRLGVVYQLHPRDGH